MAARTINKSVNIGTEENPYEAFYEETTEKNYTKIITGVKRHNRQRFVNAVKSQLLYFKGTEFKYREESGYERNIDFLARVLHNSESILISDTRQFSRPHVVIVKERGSDFGVTYGTIDFQELEMQQFFGSLGLKCPIRVTADDPQTGEKIVVSEGVTVNPSRESVIWDEYTRNYIQSVIAGAQDEAARLIEKELQEDDFFEWINKARTILSKASYGYQSALGILSNLVEMQKVKVRYHKDKSIKFYQTPSLMFPGITIKSVRKESKGGGYYSSGKTVIERDEFTSWGHFNKEKLYLMDAERHNPKKDLFISVTGNNPNGVQGFLSFKILSKDDVLEELTASQGSSQKTLFTPEQLKLEADKIIVKQQAILKYLSPALLSYESVVVPEDFGKELEQSEDQADAFVKAPEPTPAELRELNGEIVCYTFSLRYKGWVNNSELKLQKEEPKLKYLKEVSDVVVYGTQEDEENLKMLCNLYSTGQYGEDYFHLSDPRPIKVLRFSKRNLKHIKEKENFIHVDKYLWNHSPECYNIGNNFVPVFTSIFIKERLKSLTFLCNFKEFNEEAYEAYLMLTNYINNNLDSKINAKYRQADVSDTTVGNFYNNAEKGITFQTWLRDENPSPEQIKEKAKELFNNENITSALVIDESVLDILESLESFATSIGSLFSHISLLTSSDKLIDTHSSRIISQILVNEGLENFSFSEEQIQTITKLK